MTILETAASADPVRRILVAEDSETNRKVIQLQLQVIGAVAEVVIDGREALQRWRSGDYALLLTDLHMPDMDGFALAHTIRAEESAARRTPIIALTANALRDQEARCRAAGMDDYLTKPVRLADLKAAIERCLRARQDSAASREPELLSYATVPLSIVPSDDLPAVDLNVLKALIGDDPATLQDVLASYRLSAMSAGEEIRRGVAGMAYADAAMAAHRLKSAALSIGAIRLSQACREMEQAADAGVQDQCLRTLQRFSTEMHAVDSYLAAR